MSMSETDCRKYGDFCIHRIPDEEYTVIIDAVFGVGLCREITGHYKDVIDWMNLQDAEKVAVDIPSGICAATGKILGTAFRADLTVCMACVKLGCELFPGKSYAGESIPVAIGIDPKYFSNRLDVCYTFDKNDLGKLLPSRMMNSHKGSYGKVLMITGSPRDGWCCISFLPVLPIQLVPV